MIVINRKRLVLIIACLVLAIGMGLVQYLYFSSLGEQEAVVEVLIVKENIKAGQIVNDKLSIKTIPKSAYLDDMPRSIEKDNLYAKTNIKAGTYLLNSMVDTVIAPVLTSEENRRVTIDVSITAALAGKIRPGDKVDIGYIPSGNQNTEFVEIAEVIAWEVPILEILNANAESIASTEKQDNQYDIKGRIPAVATLIVENQEQGLLIKEKETKGKLFFMGY